MKSSNPKFLHFITLLNNAGRDTELEQSLHEIMLDIKNNLFFPKKEAEKEETESNEQSLPDTKTEKDSSTSFFSETFELSKNRNPERDEAILEILQALIKKNKIKLLIEFISKEMDFLQTTNLSFTKLLFF